MNTKSKNRVLLKSNEPYRVTLFGMNDKHKTVVLLLGLYLLVLPVAMVWHASQHAFGNEVKDELQGVVVTPINTPDCELCTCYFDELGYERITVIKNPKALSIGFIKKLMGSFTAAVPVQKHLRGPPGI